MLNVSALLALPPQGTVTFGKRLSPRSVADVIMVFARSNPDAPSPIAGSRPVSSLVTSQHTSAAGSGIATSLPPASAAIRPVWRMVSPGR